MSWTCYEGNRQIVCSKMQHERLRKKKNRNRLPLFLHDLDQVAPLSSNPLRQFAHLYSFSWRNEKFSAVPPLHRCFLQAASDGTNVQSPFLTPLQQRLKWLNAQHRLDSRVKSGSVTKVSRHRSQPTCLLQLYTRWPWKPVFTTGFRFKKLPIQTAGWES